MVLVDRDAVEAELLGVLELVEVAVVELVAELGVEVLVGEVQRRRGVLLVEVVGQVRVRHEVEEDELHVALSDPLRRNSVTASANASVRSKYMAWPQSSTICSVASGIRSA